jgi:hypothetical protein
VAQLSRPHQMPHMSVAQRSLGAVASDGKAWILGLNPTGRLRTYQPMIWNTRYTVFLFMSNRCVPERGVLLDHRIDGFDILVPHLGITLGGLVLHCAAQNTEPATELDQADDHAFIPQGLLQLEDHLSS